MKSRRQYCDGLDRRDVLRIGGAGLFGMGFSLPYVLEGQARAAAAGADVNKDKSLIFVFLRGGLSTIDTWDMKPNAPQEIRGEFQPIPTNVPGIQVCEHMPRLAKQMDKFSLIRSFTHTNNNHGFGDHYMLTGYHPTAAFNRSLVPNNERPAHGASVAHLLGPRGTVPPYVCLPTMHRSAGAAYLGPGAEPFVIAADPNAPDFAVPDLAPPLSVDSTRLGSRQHLLRNLGRFERAGEVAANRSAETLNVFRQKAFDLMTSPAAKTAFDIELESDNLREEYGRTTLGQSCLMARRLVEAGVRCVTIEHSGWDTHGDNFKLLKGELLPALDPAMATLFRDLDDRGMLDSTLVVVTGEFGRTPQCAGGGRGHWAPAFTVAIGGGGVQGGRTVGRTDKTAASPDLDPQGPEDLAATIHHLMGIDPGTEFHSADGRPFKLVNGGTVMRDML